MTTNQLRSCFLPSWEENPYQELLAQELEKLNVTVARLPGRTWFLPSLFRHPRPDVLHLHSPDHLVVYSTSAVRAGIQLLALVGQLVLARQRGIRLAWTAHELVNHERRYLFLDRLCRRAIAALADGIFVHCEAAKRALTTQFAVRRAVRIQVIPHGHYGQHYRNDIGRDEARRVLGFSPLALVLLFFGNIREYKGVPELIEAFRRVRQADVQLVIVGKPFTPSLAQCLTQMTASDAAIRYIPGRVPDDAVQLYMNACDVVVAPFRDVLTSGSVVLAMSFGKPCIAPRVGCLASMMQGAGELTYDLDEPDGLARAIRAAIQRRPELSALGERNGALARQWTWARMAALTCEVYRDCLAGSRGGLDDAVVSRVD
jgi:glycosyltransferase involved in cell wall biosynthesis